MSRNIQRALRVAVAIAILGAFGLSQTPPSIKQEAKNTSCANIVALAGNVDVNCSSLTPAQRKLIESIPAVLNKILANQLNPDIVMAKLDEIQKGVEGIRQSTAHRRLDDRQKRELISRLSPSAGHTVSIVCILGDTEGQDFAMDFFEVFRNAHWNVAGVDQVALTRNPIGIQIQVSAADVHDSTIPPEAQAIFLSVKTVTGIEMQRMNAGGIPKGEIQIVVGKKD